MDALTVANVAADRVITPFDMYDPAFLKTYFRTHGDQGMSYFSVWLKAIGFTEPWEHNYGDQYEESWIAPSLHCSAAALTVVDAPTGQYSMVLSNTAGSSDYIQQSALPPYPSSPALYSNPAIIGQRIEFSGANAGIKATIESITGATTNTTTVGFRLTDAAVISGATFVAAAVPSTEIWIVDNAFGAGTDQPNGQVNRPVKDQFFLQIIKTNFLIHGDVAAERLRFKEYSDGKGASSYYKIGMVNLDTLHARYMDAALLFEQPSTNPSLDVSGEPRNTTEGLVTYTKRKGTSFPYVPGSYTVNVFNQLEKIADANMHGQNYYCMASGIGIDQDKDDALKNYFNNTDINYIMKQAADELFGGNEGMAGAVGFRMFTKGYTTWCNSRMPQFNDPRGAGMPGYNYQYLQLAFPLGKKKDAKTGGNLPFFGMRYKAMDGYSRMAEFVQFEGATNGRHQTTVDRNQYGYKSHIGAMHVGGEGFMRFYQAA